MQRRPSTPGEVVVEELETGLVGKMLQTVARYFESDVEAAIPTLGAIV